MSADARGSTRCAHTSAFSFFSAALMAVSACSFLAASSDAIAPTGVPSDEQAQVASSVQQLRAQAAHRSDPYQQRAPRTARCGMFTPGGGGREVGSQLLTWQLMTSRRCHAGVRRARPARVVPPSLTRPRQFLEQPPLVTNW